jgi:hypothetical protein
MNWPGEPNPPPAPTRSSEKVRGSHGFPCGLRAWVPANGLPKRQNVFVTDGSTGNVALIVLEATIAPLSCPFALATIRCYSRRTITSGICIIGHDSSSSDTPGSVAFGTLRPMRLHMLACDNPG